MTNMLAPVKWRLVRVRDQALKGGRQITAMVFDSKLSRSYWPEDRRKSGARVLVELVWWLIRHGELNNYYYVYGLDRKGVRRPDVMPYRSFREIRNRRNLRVGRAYNYVCVLRDKFLFAQFVSSLDIPTPKALALLDRDSVTWLSGGVRQPLESLAESTLPVVDGFCKRLDGIQGEGVFPLKVGQGRIDVRGADVSIKELRKKLNGRFLLQQRIEQHPAMRALHPASVNTVRLITFCSGGEVSLFSAALRVGTNGKSVDNWAAGGVILGIDSQTAEVRGEGFFKPGYGGRTSVHPDTGVVFAGFRIPHFQEAVQIVTRLHGYLGEIHSVGWDVGISKDGPTIIEGNDDWEGGIPMVLEPDFRRRFLMMYE